VLAALAGAAYLPGARAGWAQAEPPKVRVGVLKFGTVTWELATVTAEGLDAKAGIAVEQTELAGNQATQVALQAGAVDMIVSDWLWVARLRAEGEDLAFVPYSTAVGSVMVPRGSPIRTVADLAGRRIGVAGSPIDKSWLLLQALARRNHGIDLAQVAQPVFGAPPLLDQQLAAGRLDAVLTYWNFAARLEAQGLGELIGVSGIMRDLGLATEVPAIGYVFRTAWARANPAEVAGFVTASRAAKERLGASDAAWERLRPLMRAEDEATFRTLRARYRAGIPTRWGEAERADARRLFAILADLGGRELVGGAKDLDPGTFWPGADF
jgi:NitT/TauT family transport system substrate-binding protein